MLRTIHRQRQRLADHSARELRQASRSLQFAIRAGQSPRARLADAFALVSESIRRTYDMVPYDVQYLGAINLCGRTIVEMATGEGKTLTALMPLYLQALAGKGAWLATANDYLAARDAEFAQPVFELLGLSVGSVVEATEDDQRRQAYLCDVTYGTAVQFGFDFLRDRAKLRFNTRSGSLKQQQPVGRGHLHSILVDEADSLLVDEAATPLLIAGAPPPLSQQQQELYHWAARLAPACQEGHHYRYKKIDKQVELTPRGREWAHQQIPPQLDHTQEYDNEPISLIDYYDFVQRAINVERDFLRGRNYIVSGTEVLLVDEGTGRVGKGRQWSEGIQQAVQAKEKLPITLPSGHLAKVTLQSFFLTFQHLSGMTGTTSQAADELQAIYRLGIQEIPTRLPTNREEYPNQAFPDFPSWLAAIGAECQAMRQAGRCVLIGARNVTHSERISDYLEKQGFSHQLLNARHDAAEAEIIGQAGQPGRITVATNMAGRGTDIRLHEEVRHAGGLHVVLAGIHPSRRIDRQLIGRSGRQGDPGSYRRILCLEDDLLDEAFQAEHAEEIRRTMRQRFLPADCFRLFNQAQQILTQRNQASRRAMFHDDKKNLRYLYRAGFDPLLDLPG